MGYGVGVANRRAAPTSDKEAVDGDDVIVVVVDDDDDADDDDCG